MFCSHCGKEIDPADQFCSKCGLKPPVEEIEKGEKFQPPPEESKLKQDTKKRKMPFWYKFALFIAVLALIGVTTAILFTEKLVDVVDNQLESLRNNQIEKAYRSYTSKDFQASISFDEFRNFIEAYPVFQKNQSAHFSERCFKHNNAILKGYLTSDQHVNTPIEYRLIREHKKWKILSVRLLKPDAVNNVANINEGNQLIEIAKMQLKDIQNGKISGAYENYSSKEFTEATSKASFDHFIKQYPLISSHHTILFHKPIIHNGVGTLPVIAKSDEKTLYLKYYFIYEDQNWKVWSLKVLSSRESEKSKEYPQAPS